MNKPIYRMSSAGYCPRKLSAIRLGLQPKEKPEYLAKAANEGNWHEARIKGELRNSGYAVLDEQKEIIIQQETYNLVGHLDGIAQDDKGEKLLEIKSMSQFEFDRWMKGGFAAFPEYAGQLACYFEATKLDDCLYIVKNRNSGYQDERTISRNDNGFFAIEPILQKLESVEVAAQKGELHEAEYDVNSIECRRCEFSHLCLPEPKDLNGIDTEIINKAIEQWRQGNRLMKQGDKLKETAKSLLEAYAKEQPNRKLIRNKLVVSIYDVAEAKVEYTRKAYTACTIKDLEQEND